MVTLQALYEALTAALPRHAGNPCGACNACCTGAGLTWQNVMEIELDAIEARHGKRDTDAFRRYAERARDEAGALLHPLCPFYDRSAAGCGIYADRPFSCRVFGHYRMAGTHLPDGCVFEPTVRAVDAGAYFREVPLARALRDLQRAWEARRPQPSAPTVAPLDLLERVKANIDPDDPADQAVVAHMEGRLDDALALLEEAATTRPHDAWVFLEMGNVLDELKRGPEAIGAYSRALERDPSNPRAWIHLGFSRVDLGDAVGGRDAFAHAVALQPDDPTSRGFLGWLTMATATTEAAFDDAAAHLRAATRLAPHNALFRLRCAEALILTGAPAEALTHLQAAADDPRFTAAAQAVRARFAALLDPPTPQPPSP